MAMRIQAETRHRKTGAQRESLRGTEEAPWVKWILVGLVGVFLLVFLLIPLVNVFAQALAKGVGAYLGAVTHPDTISSIRLTVLTAAICVPLNLVLGVCAAWSVAKFEFPGKTLLITLIDLPFAVSPVVAGLTYLVLFGLQGYLGPWLADRDLQVVFAVPGIVLATLFVTFPFVARELIPVMQATGTDQEQAAMTLGASGWQTFRRVTLPSVKWGLLYGVILCNARAMGEFGAVSVVSGHITGMTDTLPLRVEKLYHGYDSAGAFAVASLLALLALATLVAKSWFEWRQQAQFEAAQRLESTPSPGAPKDPP